MTTKTDFEFTLITDGHAIIKLDGEEVKIVPEGNGYHFNIKFVKPVYGKTDFKVSRDQLFALYCESRLKFYKQAYIHVELKSALYDWD